MDPGFRSPAQGDLTWPHVSSSQYPLGDRCPGTMALDEVSAPLLTSYVQLKSCARKCIFFSFSVFYCGIGHMHRLPREAMESPSLQLVKSQWAVVLCSLLQVTPYEQGLLSIPRGHCAPQHFCDFSGFSAESPWECGGQGGIAQCPWWVQCSPGNVGVWESRWL